MKQKQYLLAFFMLVCQVVLRAQQPVMNVQSPEIASLGLYGTIPISHYTGMPDISIPLYDVRVGRYTLPISASYHLASVRPDSQYGTLGMGWNLMVGGYITRIVNCIYDEKCGDNGVAHGYYSHASSMNNITNSSFASLTQTSLNGDNYYEVSADEFIFNFCGYSGSFYYNSNGGWTVISDHSIKVVFDAPNGGFINRSQLRSGIDVSRWGEIYSKTPRAIYKRIKQQNKDGVVIK